MEGEVFFTIDGEEHCNEELALARLLEAGVLFANTGYFGEGVDREPTVVLFVNCNDVFAWACADAESFTHADIPDVYRAWESDKVWGVWKWCCRHRNQKPQKPAEDAMRKAGVWDEAMQALPNNTQDAEVQAMFRQMLGMGDKETH